MNRNQMPCCFFLYNWVMQKCSWIPLASLQNIGKLKSVFKLKNEFFVLSKNKRFFTGHLQSSWIGLKSSD